jgi:hypothetical protein
MLPTSPTLSRKNNSGIHEKFRYSGTSLNYTVSINILVLQISKEFSRNKKVIKINDMVSAFFG